MSTMTEKIKSLGNFANIATAIFVSILTINFNMSKAEIEQVLSERDILVKEIEVFFDTITEKLSEDKINEAIELVKIFSIYRDESDKTDKYERVISILEDRQNVFNVKRSNFGIESAANELSITANNIGDNNIDIKPLEALPKNFGGDELRKLDGIIEANNIRRINVAVDIRYYNYKNIKLAVSIVGYEIYPMLISLQGNTVANVIEYKGELNTELIVALYDALVVSGVDVIDVRSSIGPLEKYDVMLKSELRGSNKPITKIELLKILNSGK